MLTLRSENLFPELSNGQSGTHLTAYFPAIDGSLLQQKKELAAILIKTENLLRKEKSERYIRQFLDPVRQLVNSRSGWNPTQRAVGPFFVQRRV